MTQPTVKTCERTMKLLGDYWTLRIIDALSYGELRYCELQRQLGSVSPVTLSHRLKKLEATTLVKRKEQSDGKIPVRYELTKHGQNALPVIQALNAFSQQLTS